MFLNDKLFLMVVIRNNFCTIAPSTQNGTNCFSLLVKNTVHACCSFRKSVSQKRKLIKLGRNTWTFETETFLKKSAFLFIQDDKEFSLNTVGIQPALIHFSLDHHYSFHVSRQLCDASLRKKKKTLSSLLQP